MAQQIIDVGASPDDGQGDTLRDGFIKTNNNFTQIWEYGPVNTNVRITGSTITTVQTNGNLILAPNGVAKVLVNNDFLPQETNVYEIGSSARRWNTLWVGTGGINSLGPLNFSGNITFGNAIVSNDVVAGGNGIFGGNLTVSGTTSLGNLAVNADSNITFSVGNTNNAVVISNSVTTFDQNVIISGNLNVEGNITYINIENLSVQDPVISLGRGPNNTPLTNNDGMDRGIQMWYYTASEKQAFVGFDNSQDKIIGATDVSIANNVVTVNDYGTAQFGDVQAETLSASGNVTGSYIIGDGSQLGNVYAARGPDSPNYDTLTQMGVYTVNRLSWSGVTGAPTDSMVFVGILEVKTDGSATVQTFFPGTIDNYDNVKIQFNRSLWSGSWTPWIRMTNNGQQIEGGSF